MINTDEVKKIKETVEEFLYKMTIVDFNVELKLSFFENKNGESKGIFPNLSFIRDIKKTQQNYKEQKKSEDVIDLDMKLEEPQILIGQNGQTLFELQRVLRIILNKRLQKNFYLKLDINNYRAKKIEYLKNLARDLANEVFLTKEKKILSPMPAYERRIIHIELAHRQDIITESQGDGVNRCVVISPR